MPLKFEGKKILFVNDDADFIEARTEFLTNQGATVVSALTPKEAYDQLKESKFDLIFLDINFDTRDQKNVDGLVALPEMVKHGAPVIMLSGNADKYAAQAAHLGAAASVKLSDGALA